MMINVSRFNDVQERVHGLIYQYMQTLTNAAVVHAGLGADALCEPVIRNFKKDFEAEFASREFSFGTILEVLPAALKTIVLVTVNKRGGTLDYSRHKTNGLHVIAIGGLALSRGLTLEGLTVSYILRNTIASDTLMQMARWFGYRPNYEDICRIYLPELSYDHYCYINEAIEELRGEVKRMQQVGATPEQFGLRVRQSPTAIRITAANKMRTATGITVAQDYSGRHVEGHVLANDQAINEKNIACVSKFIGDIGVPNAKEKSAKDSPVIGWRGVSGHKVLTLIREFSFPVQHGDLAHITGHSSLFADYVLDRVSADLAKWDVAIPAPVAGSKSIEDPFGFGQPVREREKGHAAGGVYRVYGARNRIADPVDARLFLTKTQLKRAKNNGARGDRQYCLERERPLLLIHVFRTNGNLAERGDIDPPHEALMLTDPVVSLSFCLPRSQINPVSRTYQVNAVYRNQLQALTEEPDDDEDYIERDHDG